MPEIWYQVRKKVGDIRQTLPPEAIGPFFNDEFGDVYGSIYAFTADGFSLSELRDYVERARQEVLRLPNVAKAELIGVQDDRIFVELARSGWPRSASIPAAIAQALRAERDRRSRHASRRADHAWRCASPASSIRSSEVARPAAARSTAQTFRLGDIAAVTRGYVDPPIDTMRFGGKEAIGLGGVDDLARATCSKLGEDLKRTMARLQRRAAGRRRIPAGLRPARGRRAAVGEFMRSLIEAVAIVLVISFLSPRGAHRAGGGAHHSAGARGDLPRHVLVRHRPAPHLDRRADHRASACWSTTR